MSVAAAQRQLQASEPGALTIELGPYLARLCKTLEVSMIGNSRPVSLEVHVEGSSSQAVSIGLIVTELVINALKHAFPDDWSDGTVVVAYELAKPNWRLTVSANGKTNPGLGTTIIEALGKQLNACLEILMNPLGTTVSIIHTAVASRPPAAA
jgi:chemotaxis protein methyltransferase CheR